ncbi:hypothetical protein H2200_003860 [Cladophialophora chaetospira]|uniref:Zn(2)-C6 fungal-type domain-containing protein n=1 Tax=Cladophialophora chaetospira TaxID=386627 RepID=A0AA38XF02_9EURO|nr:hypothetical protein H2200_003860 [Cladophialophora chaetospira]
MLDVGDKKAAACQPIRTKSKNGCKTCKVRRVRCGEERPACQRCISTGRVCDGYGIWGGGGNTYEQRYRPQQAQGSEQALVKRVKPALTIIGTFHDCPVTALDAAETHHFEWFWRRTARKIPGAFFSDAGNALFFQACVSDAAVTHGVLAMCSAHRDSDKVVAAKKPMLVQREEHFALRQYNKSIKLLQPHLRSDDTISLRIALFSCLAFIWAEFFRSRYQTAASHLEHGLRMLKHARGPPGSKRVGGNLIDDWVQGVFKKLYVYSTLFGQRPHHPWPFPIHLKPVSSVTVFLNAHEAREYLENILLEACALLEARSFLGSVKTDGTDACGHLAEKLMNDLDIWMSAYDNTLALLELQLDMVEAFACRVLRLYHTMAVIMVGTACEMEETKYDRHTFNFLLILEQMLDLRKVASNSKVREKYFGNEEGLPHSIGDMGPVAPLYYLATRCRIPRLRVQAIKLLEEEPRKEGIFDASLVANIARLIAAVEGLDVRQFDDDFHLSDLPRAEDLQLASTPAEERRLEILNILLPDAPWEPAVLTCRYRDSIVRYRIHTQPETGSSSIIIIMEDAPTDRPCSPEVMSPSASFWSKKANAKE